MEVLILKGLAVPGFAVDGEPVVVVEVQAAGFSGRSIVAGSEGWLWEGCWVEAVGPTERVGLRERVEFDW